MNFSDPTTITFTAYLLLMVGIGFAAWRYTNNLADYILGGRSLGSVVTALSVGASDMSGWLLMGLPGAVFIAGISESWIAIGLLIGAWFNWTLVAARLRVYTELAHNALTLPDFFTHRFEDTSRLLRVISAVVILVFFTIYSASGMVAGARLFESTFGLPYQTALWVGAAATIAYVFLGGFLAVSWTDSIQAALMIIALVVTPIAVMNELGGFGPAVDQVAALNPAALSLTTNQTAIGVISLLAWGLGYFGQPHILARFMAAESVGKIPAARRIGMAWMFFCLAGAVAIGFFGAAYFAQHVDLAGPVTANREAVFLSLTQALFNPWVAGVLLSAILAAVMSTLSCQLLVCSSALTEDFYKSFLRKNAGQGELVWVGRMMVLAISLLAIQIARDPDSRVLSLVGYAWAGFGAAFGPVVLLSLMWPRMTRNGALAGIVIGALTVLVWRQGGWFGLYEIVPGFVLATLAIVGVSLADRAPSKKMTETFERMRTMSSRTAA